MMPRFWRADFSRKLNGKNYSIGGVTDYKSSTFKLVKKKKSIVENKSKSKLERSTKIENEKKVQLGKDIFILAPNIFNNKIIFSNFFFWQNIFLNVIIFICKISRFFHNFSWNIRNLSGLSELAPNIRT